MKKIFKIIGIVFFIIVVIIAIVLTKNKLTAIRVEKIKNESDIFIRYFDGRIYEKAPEVEEYDLINIDKNKLYKVISINIKHVEVYTIKTKKISDEEIYELINWIKNGESANKTFSTGYYYIEYKNKVTKLKNLPFSY